MNHQSGTMVTTSRIKVNILSLQKESPPEVLIKIFRTHRIATVLGAHFKNIEHKALTIKVIVTSVPMKELMVVQPYLGKLSFPY